MPGFHFLNDAIELNTIQALIMNQEEALGQRLMCDEGGGDERNEMQTRRLQECILLLVGLLALVPKFVKGKTGSNGFTLIILFIPRYRAVWM